jgi:uncharacterized protein YuzE
MKLSYYAETDTLYISLVEEATGESDEIAEEIVVDYTQDGRVAGIEIDHASKKIDLTKLEANSLPIAG